MAARSLSQNLEVKVDTREPRNRLTSPFPNAKVLIIQKSFKIG